MLYPLYMKWPILTIFATFLSAMPALAQCGIASGGRGPGDFNCDSVIDFFDYLDLVDAFAAGCSMPKLHSLHAILSVITPTQLLQHVVHCHVQGIGKRSPGTRVRRQ